VDWVSVIAKLKGEEIRRDGDSVYPFDDGGGAPDGVIDHVETSHVDQRALRFGEGLSVRVVPIQWAALYNDFELEQVRNWLAETRASLGPSPGNDAFSRDTITHVRRFVWTFGGQVQPWHFLNGTAQVRLRRNMNDYDDTFETSASGTAKSAFVEFQEVNTNEFSTRWKLRWLKWLQPSIRYQLKDQDFISRYDGEVVNTETSFISHIFTVDVLWRPIQELMFLGSFSKQTSMTKTPARLASSANTPSFHADVNTWYLTADWEVCPKVFLFSSLTHARAENFDNFDVNGLSLGSSYRETDMTTGVRWKLNDQVAIEPKYSYYRYQTNDDAEFGDYRGHLLWLEVTWTPKLGQAS